MAVVSDWLRRRQRHPDIVVIGDSITAGYYASTRRRGYADVALDALALDAGDGLASRVTAVSGARVSDFLGRELPVASRVVVVEAGTNDWLGYQPDGPWRATSLDRFADGYRNLLDQVDDGRATAVVCLGIWGPPRGRSPVGARLEDYDAVISAACEAHGASFVQLSPVYDDPSSRGPARRPTPFGPSDKTHPNDRGHVRVAELVVATVRAAYPRPLGGVSAAAMATSAVR
jgi:lysophospholipase L1-like esterase